jgi:hypothetical protein
VGPDFHGVGMVKKLLARYRAKRDFSKTAEPSGNAKVSASKGLRFVIQKHAASHLHYDLALQLPFRQVSESMGNHDSNIVDAGSVD